MSFSSTSLEMMIKNFDSIFANCRDMMNLFSLTQGKVLIQNPAAFLSTGYTLEDLQNTPIQEYYPSEELEKLLETFRSLNSEDFIDVKINILVKSGELRNMWIRASVIMREPEIICLVCTIDVTAERTREEKALREANFAHLGEVSAILSHEMRNSLQVISANTALIERLDGHLLSDAGKSKFERIRKATVHLQNVVRNIQTNINSGFRDNTFASLGLVVKDTLELVEDYLLKQNIVVSVEIPDSIPEVRAEPGRLVQLILILVKNAVQAMSSTPIRKLVLGTECTDDITRLYIKDTGTGIPPATASRIFDAFYSTKPVGEGLGLGLAIARKLASADDIKISFDSKPDEGTTFTLALKNYDIENHPQQTKVSFNNKKVLIVDDKESTCTLLSEALEKLGMKVDKVLSSYDGIKQPARHKYDLIFCRIDLYPISGIAFATEVRRVYNGPLCMISDQRSPTFLSIKRQTDANDFLVLPEDIDRIVPLVSRLLTDNQQHEASF